MPGADQGVWGDVLNDFLLVEHNADGTLKVRTDGTFEPALGAGLASQFLRGDKTWQSLSKAAVGLGQVDNTADADKPISIATQTALDTKAADSAVVHKTGDTIAGDLAFGSGVSLTFNGAQQYLRWDPGEGLWLAVADDNKNLKLSYGGGSGRLSIDQYGFGEVARFTSGVLSMRSHAIKDLAGPTDPQDATHKQYVDAATTAIAVKSADYAATLLDRTLAVSANAGPCTITLPSAASAPGKQFTVKKTDSSGNSITVQPTVSQTIDGAVNFALTNQWQYITIQSDGANWLIIGNN